MAELNFRLENQLLTKTTEMVIASGDVGAHKCIFEFDESWNGFSKTAVFYQRKNAVQYSVLASDDSCIIPASAMTKAGIMYVGVFGVKGATILTSTMEQVEVLQGAIADGRTVSTEPTDDIFLAIISQYQAILDKMTEYDSSFTAAMNKIDQQNLILETLNAFDVVAVMNRMNVVETKNNRTLQELEKNFRINDITIKFDEKQEFIYEDERITDETLCDVYFDVLSTPTAAEAIIMVESFNGYLLFKSTYECNEELSASIYCMGV